MAFGRFDRFLLRDAQKTYKWKAVISQIQPKQVSGGGKGYLGIANKVNRAVDFLARESERLSGGLIDSGIDIELPEHTIVAVGLPSQDFEIDSIPRRGSQFKTPGANTISTLNLTFIEDDTGLVSRNLEAWRNLIYNPDTGTYGTPSEYQAQIDIKLMSGQNFEHTIFNLIGCWPATMSPTDLSYDASNNMTVTQAFAVQKMQVNKKSLKDAIATGDFEDITESNLRSQLGSFASFI